MKLHTRLLSAIAAALFAIPTMTASADIIFANEDAFDSGVNPASEDRTDTTLAGIVGASASFLDAGTGLNVTLTTIDIIGIDGTSFLAGTGTDNFHETNVNGSGQLSVNTDTNQDDIDGSSVSADATNFDGGEGFLFSFDSAVTLQSITFGNFETGAIANLVIDGNTIALTATADGETFDFEDTFVAAGTEILLTNDAVTTTNAGDNQFNITSIQLDVVAAIPEPSSLAALGLLGSLAMIRRRR